jgi:hypothetical protein
MSGSLLGKNIRGADFTTVAPMFQEHGVFVVVLTVCYFRR